MPSPTRRPLRLAVLAAALVPLALAGCTTAKQSAGPSSSAGASSSAASATPSATATPLSCASPGAASRSVTVSGTFASAPKVTFKAPVTAKTTERSTLRKGSGATVKEGDTVVVGLVAYDARTGSQLASSAYGTAPLTVSASRIIPGLARSLDCTKVGERLVSVVPASDAFGTAGSPTIGVKGGDSLVFVIDVRTVVTMPKANGRSKALPSGFPTVTLASDGKPSVTIPKATAPKTLRIAESKAGTGATVKSTDIVALQYQGVLWRTGKVFDQSWGRSLATFQPGAVVPGFGKALVGHKVGSQVVAIIPPKDGYGTSGSAGAGIKGTDTMVFVVDILASGSAG
jgi:peptidylprolyl isomerase